MALRSRSPNRVLILASGSVEFLALQSYLVDSQETLDGAGTIYEVGFFGPWQVALTEIDLGGPSVAAEVVSAVEFFSPELVVTIGIASGLRDVRIGDVVAATKIYGYEYWELHEEYSFEALSEHWESSYAALQRARAEARKGNWQEHLELDDNARVFRALAGPVAVGKGVATATALSPADYVRSLFLDAVAFEKEGTALLTAVTGSGPHMLFIRGISELTEEKAESEPPDPQLAARNAAAFVLETLTNLETNGRSSKDQSLRIPDKPIELRSLDLRNLRIFDRIALPFHPRQPEAGQWTVILGDNGVGKTTILRALVFGLADQRLANSFFQLGGSSAPFLRDAGAEGEVEVALADGRYRARITSEQDIERLVKLDPEAGIPLYAYGCQRGTALGGPAREVEFRPIDDVRSLFDDAGSLIHAETWLQNLRLAALESNGGSAEAFFDAVRDTVVGVLSGVEALDVDKDGVWLAGPNVDRAPLAALSDGYITTAGWLIDLIARWSHRCRRSGIELDRDFSAKMNALVLIDEIDLHLHPLWQVEILDTLRERFPRLSVVATTHNPLALLGARKGEIHVLRREPESGRISARQRDIPPGARADQVLTGDWFGLASTVDHGTRALLSEHRGLLRRQVPADDVRRRELEDELRRRLGTYADTAVDRIVQSIAAELMGEDFEELTSEQRRAIRDKIRRRARERSS